MTQVQVFDISRRLGCLRRAAVLAASGLGLWFGGPACAGPRVASLDSCADQYVLALSPRSAIVGLSFRARAEDSYMAAAARGLPRRRATLESLLAIQPQLVVRSWGGEANLVRRLESRGVLVLHLADAHDFAGVRANIRLTAQAVGDPLRGEGLIRSMDARLAGVRPSGRRVAYLTPGGATAGPGTFVDALLRAAGLRNAETRPGYRLLSLERLALSPPVAWVLGFFDAGLLERDWWSPARSSVFDAVRRRQTLASLPGRLLSCPAWFAAEGVESLANDSSL